MSFEVNLPSKISFFILRRAGLETKPYQDCTSEVMSGKANGPIDVKLSYFLSAPPSRVTVTLLDYGRPVRLRISADDAIVERKIQAVLEHYSDENNGEARLEREEDESRKQIDAVLKREGLTYQQIDDGGAMLNRRAIEGLTQLATVLEPHQLGQIYYLFHGGQIARADKEFASRWLMERLAVEPDPLTRGELGLRVWENISPALGDELVKLMASEIRKHGNTAAGLIMALAKTKHPQAADFIASHLDKPGMTWAGVQALAKLKATQHVDRIRRYLRDPAIRSEAKKAMKKLGVQFNAPPPIHLVRMTSKVPKNLKEWSQNLDASDLTQLLKKLAKCVDDGFAEDEIAEVIGVVDEMRSGLTKAFQFEISAAGERGELRVVIFMDDVESPDLKVYARPAVIEKLVTLMSLE